MRYLTYNELIQLPTFEERFKYLQLNGRCSEETFGGHRVLNQMLYNSPQWQEVRRRVIVRDNGCDLAIPDRPIGYEYPPSTLPDGKGKAYRDKILIHHLNPITIEQVTNFDPAIFDLNNLICTCKQTHNAIHYGDGTKLAPSTVTERKPGDTRLW